MTDPAPDKMNVRWNFGHGITPPDGLGAVSNVNAIREKELDSFRGFGVDEATLQQARDRTPISAADRRIAEHKLNACKSDLEWTKRYLNGGQAERREMAALTLNLGRPVTTTEQPK